jgi:hypothetical protein
VIIGNGRNTPFSEAKWINGVAPKDIAPNLFKSTRFKRKIVQKELQNDNWVRSLPMINNHNLLFKSTRFKRIIVQKELSIVNLQEENDVISWRWTADGQYSVSYAYECQFRGAFAQFPTTEFWKARTEPKCKFFS